MATSTSFTAAGNGTAALVPSGSEISYSLSGTFSATLQLVYSNSGGNTWTVITQKTAAATGTYILETKDGAPALVMWRCTAFTSGTAVTSFSSNDMTDDNAAEELSAALAAMGAGQATRWTVVIAGQSNGEGNGVMPATIPASIAGCMMIGKDNVYRNLVEPSHYRYAGAVNNWTPYGGNPNNPTYSMTTDLANWLKRLTGSDVLILPCAIGSTTVTQWVDQAYVDPPVEGSLFGQMRKRIDLATGGDYSRLIIVHHGHEGNTSGTTASRALLYANLIAAYRYWFGANVPIIFPQLASHTDSATSLQMAAGADTQWRLDQDYGDSTTFLGLYTASTVKTINSGMTAASPDWITANTNANNVVNDIAGGIQFVQDGTNPTALLVQWTPIVGKKYRVTINALCNAGTFKIGTNGGNTVTDVVKDGVSIGTSASNLGSGLYQFVFTYASGNFSFQRNSSGQVSDMRFTGMIIEEDTAAKHPKVYTYPTWDVAMNGSTDAFHLATAGLQQDGKRAAYCIAKRVLVLPDLRTVDGSGNFVAHVGHPHLTSARNVSGSTTVVSLFFNQAISNVGATNLYLVEVSGVAQTISGVAINGGDATRVDITLSSPITAGTATASYAAVQENSDGSPFTNFLRNAEGLPPLRFYRYPVAAT